MTKQRLIFAASVAGLLAVFALGSTLYRQERATQLGFLAEKSFTTFVRPHSLVLGSQDAKVYLVEFTDPACETCAAFAPMVKNFVAANPGRLKLVVRYAPLHPGSDTVCRILHASSRQGKFWETLDVMYKTQPAWASHHQPRLDQLWSFLPQAGLDLERLERDMQDPEIAKIVEQDLADSRALGATKTPGFFVNGKPLVTFGANELNQLVQAELATQYPK